MEGQSKEQAEAQAEKQVVHELWLGQAGSGKSTAIKALTQRKLVLGPTGVSAWNLETYTINSYFSLGLCDVSTKDSLRRFRHRREIRAAEIIIIDECFTLSGSQMVLTMKLLKELGATKKFILVGDPAQLLSVDKPFISPEFATQVTNLSDVVDETNELTLEPGDVSEQFSFESMAWKVRFFRQQYRQNMEFHIFCKQFRNNKKAWQLLYDNIDKFSKQPHDNAPAVFYSNVEVESYNTSKLAEIPGELIVIKRDTKDVTGDKKFLLSNEFKVGCPIMLLRNYNVLGGLCNGTVAKFIAYDTNTLICSIDDKIYNLVGYPYFRLSYAMTIHKAQGLTLDKINIHIDKRYANSSDIDRLVYVALTRVRNFEDIHVF